MKKTGGRKSRDTLPLRIANLPTQAGNCNFPTVLRNRSNQHIFLGCVCYRPNVARIGVADPAPQHWLESHIFPRFPTGIFAVRIPVLTSAQNKKKHKFLKILSG